MSTVCLAQIKSEGLVDHDDYGGDENDIGNNDDRDI